MIDPGALAAKITGAIGSGDGASIKAVQATIDGLEACWDEAISNVDGSTLSPPNPYRHLVAAQYAAVDDGDQLATAKADDPRGVWIVWRTQGVRADGFTTIFPQHAEIDALRQVNADGYGHAEFIEFGTDAAF